MLAIPQPRVSELLTGKADKFSSDKLIQFRATVGIRFVLTTHISGDGGIPPRQRGGPHCISASPPFPRGARRISALPKLLYNYAHGHIHRLLRYAAIQKTWIP
jgi:hypothetical protein